MSDETSRWTVGGARITALVEAETVGIPVQLFFPTATADDVKAVEWLDAGTAGSDGTIGFRVQAFVIEFSDRTVLVDPCVGNGKQRSLPFWHDLQLPWLDRFHAAGFAIGDIDTVVHTHPHEDHLGWDTHRVENEWVPTFAGRHVYVDDELAFAERPDRRADQDPYADSIEPIVRAGLADPSIAEVADWDVAMATATRAAFFDECVTSGSVVAGTHFAVEPVGRIEAHAGAWRFRSLPGQKLDVQ